MCDIGKHNKWQAFWRYEQRILPLPWGDSIWLCPESAEEEEPDWFEPSHSLHLKGHTSNSALLLQIMQYHNKRHFFHWREALSVYEPSIWEETWARIGINGTFWGVHAFYDGNFPAFLDWRKKSTDCVVECYLTMFIKNIYIAVSSFVVGKAKNCNYMSPQSAVEKHFFRKHQQFTGSVLMLAVNSKHHKML